MQTLEFEAYSKNGIIEIPEQYKDFDNSKLKVIILKEETNEDANKVLQLISEKRIKVDKVEIPNREERNAR